ncbi:MAG: PLP-dependent aminotransferase family protein, partial [Actinomycetota bacterium]|nr:PLP-dependent aminotransferase family protein [Actinomycetota bacterium]
MTIDDPPERSTRRDLERYAGLFSARTRVMTSSATRDLMAMSDRADVISFAGGLPDTSSFPPEIFAAMTARIAEESCARALQYGPTEGLAETKGCIVDVMAAENMAVDPADVLVTTGGQQVLDLVTKTLIDPGDTIVAEGPSYPGALNAFQAYQANVVQIDMDSDGMRVDLLEETLDRLDRDGKRPKFIYTVPSFQNPGGVTMSLPRRKRLVEVARERELLVLEDNPYGLLRYEGEPLPTLHSLDGGIYVMYLGTFSKIFSPGLRLGWVVAPPPVLARINLGKQQADLCTSTLSQILVHAYFEHHDWREYVGALTELYRARRDTMLDALAEHFPP